MFLLVNAGSDVVLEHYICMQYCALSFLAPQRCGITVNADTHMMLCVISILSCVLMKRLMKEKLIGCTLSPFAARCTNWIDTLMLIGGQLL